MNLEQGRALQNHRVVEVGKDIRRPFGPAPLFRKDYMKQEVGEVFLCSSAAVSSLLKIILLVLVRSF